MARAAAIAGMRSANRLAAQPAISRPTTTAMRAISTAPAMSMGEWTSAAIRATPTPSAARIATRPQRRETVSTDKAITMDRVA